MMDLLDYKFLNRPLSTWGTALLVTLSTLLALLILRRALRGRLGAWIARFPGQVDDIAVATLASTHSWYLLTVSIYAGSRAFPLAKQTSHWLHIFILVISFVQAGRWVQGAVKRSVETWARRAGQLPSQSTHGAAIMFGTNLIVWSVVLLLVLQNLGVEIGALVAGLGVGGVAAAFALQAVLGDLFASLSIYIDRPFDIGDFIILGDVLGTVEQVGLRTTRLTSLTGEHIVLPNADVTSSRIRNYRRMHERRGVAMVRVPYGTPVERVRSLPNVIREIVESTEGVRFDRSHFKGFGEFALEFEYVFYALSPDMALFMTKQQEINLEIMRRFEELGVQFAIPTRNVHVNPWSDAGLATLSAQNER